MYYCNTYCLMVWSESVCVFDCIWKVIAKSLTPKSLSFESQRPQPKAPQNLTLWRSYPVTKSMNNRLYTPSQKLHSSKVIKVSNGNNCICQCNLRFVTIDCKSILRSNSVKTKYCSHCILWSECYTFLVLI